MSQNAELRTLLRAVRKLVRAFDLHSRRIDRKIGLTLPQLVVLTLVRDLGEVTGRAISEEAELSPATVVGILDNLESKGLIERYRSSVDRRIVHTRLTEKGAATLAAAPPPLGVRLEQAFLKLPDSERAATLTALHRLADLSLSDVEETVPSAG